MDHRKSRQQGGAEGGPPVPEEHLYTVVEALDIVAKETGKLVPQIALNWLLQRPSVANIVTQNLGAIGWQLSKSQIALLDAASSVTPIYPYWHQMGFNELNPKPVIW